MKVILLQDVKGVGKKGQTVEVSDGYANNFILPRRLGVMATKRSQEILNLQIEDARKKDEENRLNAQEVAKQLETITLEFVAPSGKDGRMFGSISSKQIVDALKSKHNILIDKSGYILTYKRNELKCQTTYINFKTVYADTLHKEVLVLLVKMDILSIILHLIHLKIVLIK